jgi:hypothetical protein
MVRFAVPWTSRPVCSIINETKGVPIVPGEVTRERMILSRGFAFLDTLAYRCVGYQ